jgi:HK97 family phage portal protein
VAVSLISGGAPVTVEPVSTGVGEPIANDLRRGSEPFDAGGEYAYPSLLGSAFGAYSAADFNAGFAPFAPGGAVDVVGDRVVSYAEIFATQPWVSAAVMRLLTWAVRVPLKAYRRTGEDSRERLRDHPLADAIVAPWDRAGMAQLVQSMLGPLLVHGNGLVRIEEGRGGALRFEPRDWRRVKPIGLDAAAVQGWEYLQDPGRGTVETMPVDGAVHLAWWSPLGPLGVSPLKQLGTTIAMEDAAQRYARANFRNSARPPSAISAATEFLGLKPEERSALLAQLREDITTLYAGPENSGRPALLPPGLTWEAVGHTAVEAALIEQRQLNREEVAAVYQVPPPMMGDLRRATYSNITTLREMSYTDALGPPLVLIEQAINAQVVRTIIRDPEVFVEFDFAGVLRGDRLKEVQALREAIGTGLMAPNEGRRVLNLPRSDEPDADRLYLPRNNLQPLGATAEPAAEPVEPPTPPDAEPS